MGKMDSKRNQNNILMLVINKRRDLKINNSNSTSNKINNNSKTNKNNSRIMLINEVYI